MLYNIIATVADGQDFGHEFESCGGHGLCLAPQDCDCKYQDPDGGELTTELSSGLFFSITDLGQPSLR
jgi:hypothetical protein